jgi:hypothetical protein
MLLAALTQLPYDISSAISKSAFRCLTWAIKAHVIDRWKLNVFCAPSFTSKYLNADESATARTCSHLNSATWQKGYSLEGSTNRLLQRKCPEFLAKKCYIVKETPSSSLSLQKPSTGINQSINQFIHFHKSFINKCSQDGNSHNLNMAKLI